MTELVFECDPARAIRRRTCVMLVVAAALWTVVTMYLPWAVLGFLFIALYVVKWWRIPDSLPVEVCVTEFDSRVRRKGEDRWVELARGPFTWGASVVMRVPESVLPFGMLWLNESMLGAHLFRQLRTLK